MHYIKDTGFIIRRQSVSEADRYITILTLNHGKIEVLAKGIRKLSSRRAGNLELLNKISFQAVSKTSSSRLVLADLELMSSHASLKKTLSDIHDLFTMCELLITLCPYHQKQEEVFRLLEKTLKNMKDGAAKILEAFQVDLLTALGYWDAGRVFANETDLSNFAESVMERKIHSHSLLR